MVIKDILKYQDNSKYISILFQDEEGKLYILIARTNSIEIESIVDSQDFLDYDRILSTMFTHTNVFAKIPFENKNGSFFHLVQIKDESYYDFVNKILKEIV